MKAFLVEEFRYEFGWQVRAICSTQARAEEICKGHEDDESYAIKLGTRRWEEWTMDLAPCGDLK